LNPHQRDFATFTANLQAGQGGQAGTFLQAPLPIKSARLLESSLGSDYSEVHLAIAKVGDAQLA